MDVAPVIAVILAGLLTGSELTSWGIVHPVLWKLDHQAQLRAEKLTYRRFATVDPFLMTGTVAACFAAVGAFDGGDSSRLALAAGGCFALMLTITLLGNMPINLRVLRWDEEGDPGEWRRLRRRWDRLHTVRIVLDVAGFLLITLAVAT